MANKLNKIRVVVDIEETNYGTDMTFYLIAKSGDNFSVDFKSEVWDTVHIDIDTHKISNAPKFSR